MDFWIGEKCRRMCFRRLSAVGAVALTALGFCAVNRRYIVNFFRGPFPVSEAELLRVTDPDQAPHYFVRVTGARAIETGVQEIAIEKRNGAEVNRSLEASYYVLEVGSHFLLVKNSTVLKPTDVQGSLHRIPQNLYQNVFSTPEEQASAALFYPFYLDATGFRTPGYYGTVVTILLALFLFAAARPAVLWLMNSDEYPVLKLVRSWGDPASISADVEHERDHVARLKVGRFTFTDKYLLQDSFFTFQVFRLEDALWGYKHVVQRRVYHVIPAGKTFSAVLAFYGGGVNIAGNEATVEDVLAYAAAKAPWAVWGYSNELAALFRKKTRDFCAGVEARRRQIAPRG